MRRFALIFAVVVGLSVGILNWVDTRYPGGIRAWLLNEAPPQPAAPTQEIGAPFQNPAPSEAPAAGAQPAAVTTNSFEESMTRALWPGAKIEKVVYGARPYLNMTVVSISAQNVVMRNENELVSIPTGSLPDDLREKAVAYLNGTDGPPFARSGTPAFPVEAIAPPVQTAPQEAVAGPGDSRTVEPPDFESLAWDAARQRAEWWLRFERQRRNTDVLPLVTGVDLKKPYPVSGLPGYWRVRGRGYVATHQTERGGTFHDFQITVVMDSIGKVLRADFKLE